MLSKPKRSTIAIVDTLYPFGHKSLNGKLIRLMSHHYDLVVFDFNCFYSEVEGIENVTIVDIGKLLYPARISVIKKIAQLYNMCKVILELRNVVYDSVFFTSYDNFSFSFLFGFLANKNIYILHNNNIDMIRKREDEKRFDKYKNRVNHIVLSDHIKSGIHDKFGVAMSRIFVIRHPLIGEPLPIKFNEIDLSNEKMFTCLGLSNNEDLISDIINFEKKTGYFITSKYSLIIRSKKHNYSSGKLRVFSGVLSEAEYFKYYRECSAFIILYPESFENRFSASLLNALYYRKHVISTDIKAARHIRSLFPNSIRIISGMLDLIDCLENFKFQFDESEYNHFLNYYSDTQVEQEILEAFKKF